MGDVKYLVESLTTWKRVTDHIAQYQRHVDQNLKNVKLNVDEISHEHTVLREVVGQLLLRQMIAPEKEGNDMSEALVEKLHSIDNRLTEAQAEIKHISSSISRVEGDVKQLHLKIDKVLEKFETTATKTDLKDRIESVRWTLSFLMVGISVAAGILIKVID